MICYSFHSITLHYYYFSYIFTPLPFLTIQLYLLTINDYKRFHAERNISLLKVYRGLKEYHEKLHHRPWFTPNSLLESVVESGASLREEIYFRSQHKQQ